MLSKKWSVLSVVAMGVAAVACGGGSSGDTSATPPSGTAGAGGSGAGGSASGGTSAGGGAPVEEVPTNIPKAPPGPAGDGTGTNVQGVKKIFLAKDAADVFKQAYAIDGKKFSNPEDPAHCKLQTGGKKKDVVLDGPKGEDNSFGKNIVPIILGLAPDAEETINDSIAGGSFSVLVRIEKLGAGAAYSPLVAELFAAAGQRDASGNDVAPTNWGTYEWQPYPEALDGDKTAKGDALHSAVKFPTSYLVDNLWVSGAKGTVALNLSLSGQTLKLTINQAVVTAKYAADHKTANAGIISGVLDTTELTTGIKSIAGKISSSLCDGTTIDNVLMQISGASDMMKDGTQGAGTCDGISIGLGFESEQTMIGSAAPPAQPGKGCGELASLPSSGMSHAGGSATTRPQGFCKCHEAWRPGGDGASIGLGSRPRAPRSAWPRPLSPRGVGSARGAFVRVTSLLPVRR